MSKLAKLIKSASHGIFGLALFFCLGVFCLQFTFALPAFANNAIAFSNQSVNSISFSSKRTKTADAYVLTVFIEGIDTRKVQFKREQHSLVMLAQSGGSVNKHAIAGAQRVEMAFDFPANADLAHYQRQNSANKITITVGFSE